MQNTTDIEPYLDAPYVPDAALAHNDPDNDYDDPNAMFTDMSQDEDLQAMMHQISQEENEPDMIAMMDVLQCLGVPVEYANRCAAILDRSSSPRGPGGQCRG